MTMDNEGHNPWPPGIIYYDNGIKYRCPRCHKNTIEIGPDGYRCTNCKWPGNLSLFGMKIEIEPTTVDDLNTMLDAEGEEPVVTLHRLVPRLIGCALNSYDLELNFGVITGSEQEDLLQEEPQIITFQRGDVNGDGSVNIIDAMFGAQYLIGLRSFEQIHPLNLASVKHDGEDGDVMNIIDCMYVAQYVVGLRDCYFETIP